MTRRQTVTIAVPTFRRPHLLAQSLPRLVTQARQVSQDERYDVDVLVIDNDDAASARPVVAAVAGSDVRYVVEATPGISAARNRALAEASTTDLLVFIDDDEQPTDGWLDGLLATQRDYAAVAVAGRVVSVFETTPPQWMTAGGFFARRHRIGVQTGAVISEAATNNLLLDLNVVRAERLDFDHSFGLSGGEDAMFTRHLTELGYRIIWCAEALVTEFVPHQRLRLRWALLHALSAGNSSVHVDLRLTPSWAGRNGLRLRHLLRGVLRLCGGSARAVVGVGARSAHHRGAGLRAAARGAGMIAGACNWTYQEYRRPATRVLDAGLSEIPSSAGARPDPDLDARSADGAAHHVDPVSDRHPPSPRSRVA